MAIALDAATATSSTSGTSLTYSHTCTGTNLILFVGIVTQVGNNSDVVTGVTYNSVPMTRINTVAQTESGGEARGYLYYLLAPTTGANNVIISTNTSLSILSASTSYTGAKQSGVPDASATALFNVNQSQNIDVSVTTVANNCWVVGLANNGSGNFTANAGTTIRNPSGALSTIMADNGAAKTPAGSVTLSVVRSPNSNGIWCAASFAPLAPVTINYLKSYRRLSFG